ncbi:uncharacterized protein MELLADRAFT_108498 [Melampsora larici-populina 98AG31]|uniref:Uncharacterized protein n=1 Tax=Melampsora larici-populina (strain 98AG31 / pathotype 3-4-7) TaxID=747676 RepID=F4RTA1_MELLP|nr:uncharacterized protein MELLADRAFT_108498 [Melampsora larici-populina 98AG31]EGG04378.1 hypothetical protein MELLADRAFT_108498 [Melampsora larici-populina 98AG31]
MSDDDRMDALAITTVCLRVALAVDLRHGYIPLDDDSWVVRNEEARQREANMPECDCSNCEPDEAEALWLSQSALTIENFDSALEMDADELLELADSLPEPPPDLVKDTRHVAIPCGSEDPILVCPLMISLVKRWTDSFAGLWRTHYPSPSHLTPDDFFGQELAWVLAKNVDILAHPEDIAIVLVTECIPGQFQCLFDAFEEWKAASPADALITKAGERRLAASRGPPKPILSVEGARMSKLRAEAHKIATKEARLDERRKAAQLKANAKVAAAAKKAQDKLEADLRRLALKEQGQIERQRLRDEAKQARQAVMAAKRESTAASAAAKREAAASKRTAVPPAPRPLCKRAKRGADSHHTERPMTTGPRLPPTGSATCDLRLVCVAESAERSKWSASHAIHHIATFPFRHTMGIKFEIRSVRRRMSVPCPYISKSFVGSQRIWPCQGQSVRSLHPAPARRPLQMNRGRPSCGGKCWAGELTAPAVGWPRAHLVWQKDSIPTVFRSAADMASRKAARLTTSLVHFA